MKNTKYELLDNDTILSPNGTTLRRIRALKSFDCIGVGDLGGYIESELNLSIYDNAWISDNAIVFERAQVYDNAKVSGSARISGNAFVFGNSKVSGRVHISEKSIVSGRTRIRDDVRISGNARILENVRISGNAHISGNAVITGKSNILGCTIISGNAFVFGNAYLSKCNDYFWISNIGSENGTYTSFKDIDGNILVSRGCFVGTIDEFEAAVDKKHIGKINQEYKLIIELTKLRLGKTE